ncbi:unnamed protein product [Closterium sp. NIES-54]
MTTLRVLLHVAAQRDYELHSLDFSTAFLQGSLHEEIWLRRPPGFTGSFPPGTQWSLRRPVYGLRQAPREWHDTLRTTLAALGFAPSTADPSLFLRTDASLPPFYVLVYVDDLVFATADTAGLAHVKSELQKRHTCTDLGELRSYLGLQITRDRAQRTIHLTQSHMVQQILQRFDFTYSSPQATPLSTRHSLSALPSDESVEPSGPYPELVGCLMYLMTCTRPDLAYPLSILARYVAPRRHRPEHMAAAKRVLRYLCSTSGMGVVLGGRRPVVLTGHADASWADDQATQRSSQGYTFSLGSGSVSWRSTRSSSVLSSSCEAEIYAGAMAAQELRWLTYLLTDLGEQPRSPPVLYVDNKAMLALCREHRLEHRTKHIALRYFLARELQQRGQLRLAYVASEANTADIFTKALAPGDHQRFCTMLAFTGADGKPVVLSDVLLVPDLKANLISLRKLAKCGVSTSTNGAKTFTGQLGKRVLWDLHESRDICESMWQLPVTSWGKEGGSQGKCNAIAAEELKVSARGGETDSMTAHCTSGVLQCPHCSNCKRKKGTDRGGEFLGEDLTAWLKKEGIIRELTTSYTPQSNGIAERANRTVLEMARALLIESELGNSKWPHAVRHTTVVKNRVFTNVGGESWVPMERWLGRKPPIDVLRVFGCMEMAHIPKAHRCKLGATAVWCVHLGLAAEIKGWLLWEPSKGVGFDSRDVKFMEDITYRSWSKQQKEKLMRQLEQTMMGFDAEE